MGPKGASPVAKQHSKRYRALAEKIERGRVRPLQVIERNNQGMVSAREGSYEVLEDKPKTVLGLRRPQRDGRGLRP